jgi:uncharacterized protein YeeX (DUF496 family)
MKKIKPIKESYWKVLKRIQDSVPQEWYEKLRLKGKLSELDPKVKKLKEALIKGASDKENTKEVRHKCQILLDSEEFDKVIEITDKKYEKKIDEFITKEIEKASARGELPKGKKGRNIEKKLKRLNNLKYGTRTNTKS